MYIILGIIGYFIMFLITLLFWSLFGKKLGFDYDKPKTYANFDDWSSNKSAYTVFALCWPIDLIIGIITCLWLFFYAIGEKVMNRFLVPKNNEELFTNDN